MGVPQTAEGKAALATWISDNGALFKGRAPALPADPKVVAPYTNPLYAQPVGSLLDRLKARYGIGG